MPTTSIFHLAASVITLAQLTYAGFGTNTQTNVAVYWGQNSYGQANSQLRLRTYCSNAEISIIPVAFMTGIQTPTTNFANAGNNCTVYSGTQLWSCPQIEEDIKTCQTTYSKTIILSLGGSAYTEGGFASTATAQTNATNVWNLFGPNTTFANRPFGSAIVDGFDFDFEASTKNTAPFAQKLRDLSNAATAANGKKYYLSAAPQCPYPDVAQNDILSNVSLDYIMVQFYNNYCGVSSFTSGTQTQANFNMATWHQWATATSKNTNVKVFLGVPASSGAANGYVNATGLASVISYCKTFSSFGGVMMWDMSQMVANTGFLDGVYAALGTSTSSKSSTYSTTSTTTTSKSSTATTTTTTSKASTATSTSTTSKASSTMTTTTSQKASTTSTKTSAKSSTTTSTRRRR